MLGNTILNKYRVDSLISESINYEVYAATEIETGVSVAFKILKREMSCIHSKVRNFSDEIQKFASLSHPSITEILDIDIFEDRPFVITEKVEGQDVLTLLKTTDLTLQESVNIIKNLATVLQYANDQGVQYRTIKLSNVIIKPDGGVKVLSFTHPRLKFSSGNLRAISSGVHSDLFFLGITFYELLAGDSPIRKRGGVNELWDLKLEQKLRIRHSELDPKQIEKIVDFVRKTFTRECKNRFNSHEEFLRAVADINNMVRLIARRNEKVVEISSQQSELRKKSDDLKTASQVVDALNAVYPKVASLKNNSAFQSSFVTGQKQKDNTPTSKFTTVRSRLQKMITSATEGITASTNRLFASDGNLALSDEIQPVSETETESQRPELSILEPQSIVPISEVWGREETTWFKNPLLLLTLAFITISLVFFLW